MVELSTSMNMREESRRSVTLSDRSSNTRSCACKEIFIKPAREAAMAAAMTVDSVEDNGGMRGERGYLLYKSH